MSGRVEARLKQLKIDLPPPPPPAANYRPFVKTNGLVQLAGVAPSQSGRYAVVGKVGQDVDLDRAREAARLCALNLIANLREACEGDLDRVSKILMIRGFVNAADHFEQIPQVIDGASDLIVQVFGAEIGDHARTSVGCATLPSRVAVEIDAIALIDGAVQ